jgi:hypothetical protein
MSSLGAARGSAVISQRRRIGPYPTRKKSLKIQILTGTIPTIQPVLPFSSRMHQCGSKDLSRYEGNTSDAFSERWAIARRCIG